MSDPLYEDVQMQEKDQVTQAREAIGAALRRIREQPEVGYYLGLGTQTYALLTEAYASITGQRVRLVREVYLPRTAWSPKPKEKALRELAESAITDFRKLAPLIGGAAEATAALYEAQLNAIDSGGMDS